MTEQSRAAAPAVNKAEEALTHIAIACGSSPPKRENIRAVIVHTGLPGGCPTSRRAAVTRYSGQSQREASGSRVRRYIMRAAANVSRDAALLKILADGIFILQN